MALSERVLLEKLSTERERGRGMEERGGVGSTRPFSGQDKIAINLKSWKALAIHSATCDRNKLILT